MSLIRQKCGLLLALTLPIFACQGQPVSMVVEQGGSVLIPLNAGTDNPVLGYGSEVYTDYQRGELVFYLSDINKVHVPGELPLLTRAVSLIEPSQRSAVSRSQLQTGALQVVALLDVPVGATPGTYYLDVERVFPDMVVAGTAPTYNGELTIVAKPPLDAAQPTPFEAVFGAGAGGIDISAEVTKTMPDPTLVVTLTPPAHSVEFALNYPEDTIDIQDVRVGVPLTGTGNDRGIAWFNSGAGTLNVGAVSITNTSPIERLEIVFTLDDPTVQGVLDHVADVTIPPGSVVGTDETGTPITSPNISVTKLGVF